MLGEDRLTIRDDIEDTASALDQLGLDAEFFLEPGPQTGGTREIVSTDAVCDRHLHFEDSSLSPISK
jgi:hypothetical protein